MNNNLLMVPEDHYNPKAKQRISLKIDQDNNSQLLNL